MNSEIPLDVEIIVAEEDNSVYIKFAGFDDVEEAEAYAMFLSEYLPLMLLESEVLH